MNDDRIKKYMRVMRKAVYYGLVLVVAGHLAACSTGREARLLVLATLSQTLAYEQAIDAKIAAEKSYYQHSIDSIIRSMGRSQEVKKLIRIERWAQSVQRAISRNRHDLEAADLTDYVDQLLQGSRSDRLAYLETRKQYDDELQQALLQLQRRKTALAQIIHGLEQLQAEALDAEQFRLWYQFAADVEAGMKNRDSIPATAPAVDVRKNPSSVSLPRDRFWDIQVSIYGLLPFCKAQ